MSSRLLLIALLCWTSSDSTGASQEGAPLRTPESSEEVGYAVRVTVAEGSVLAGIPAAGLEVILGVGDTLAPDAPNLASGTTDSGGVCELRLSHAVVAAARARGGDLWARAAGSGWSSRTRRVPIPPTTETLEIRLVVRHGFTIRGRVLGEHGEPTSALIEARGVTSAGARAYGFGELDPDGWFEIHLDHAGTYDLIARAALRTNESDPGPELYAGLGSLRNVSIGNGEVPRKWNVRLDGPGALRGRVQSSDGSPVAGLELTLRSVLVSAAGEDRAATSSRLSLEGAGASEVEVRTGADGRFEVRGLRADRFDITTGFPPRRLNGAPLPSDGQPLVLTFDHPHLIVRVVDAIGGPRATESSRTRDLWASGSTAEWGSQARVRVVPAGATLVGSDWSLLGPLDSLPGASVEDGSLSFEVRPGAEYLIGLLGGPTAWRPIRMRAPESGLTCEVTLRLGADPGTGTLSLLAADSAGPVTDGIRVLIEDLESGQPILGLQPRRSAAWPLELRIPAGDYRLAVEGHGRTESFHGTLMHASEHGRFEADLHVAADQVTELQAHLPAGARLDLSLVGQRAQADLDAIVERWGAQHPDTVEYLAQRAQVQLTSLDRWPRPVPFRWEDTETSSAGTHTAASLPIGTRQTSEVIPAGRYVLEVRMPGGRFASAPVTLRDGETSSVELEL